MSLNRQWIKIDDYKNIIQNYLIWQRSLESLGPKRERERERERDGYLTLSKRLDKQCKSTTKSNYTNGL